MRRFSRKLCTVVLTLLTSGLSGCASLSLFSSNHYHGTPEIEQRLNRLEQRTTALEAAVHGVPAPIPGPSNMPPMPAFPGSTR